jgi:hypothetical protein
MSPGKSKEPRSGCKVRAGVVLEIDNEAKRLATRDTWSDLPWSDLPFVLRFLLATWIRRSSSTEMRSVVSSPGPVAV